MTQRARVLKIVGGRTVKPPLPLTERLAAKRIREEFANTEPMTAQSLADLTGLPLTEVVPELNRMRAEGLVCRVSIGESGLVGWRLP